MLKTSHQPNMDIDLNSDQIKQIDQAALNTWICRELDIAEGTLEARGKKGKRLRSRIRIAENNLRREKWSKDEARNFIIKGFFDAEKI